MKLFNKILVGLAGVMMFVTLFADKVQACSVGLGETFRPEMLQKSRNM